MVDIYDSSNGLQIIIEKNHTDIPKKIEINKKVVVIVYLYYEDQLEYNVEYLKNIPSVIDMVIVSSNDTLLKNIKELFEFNGNIRYIQSKNKGRELSALLVECKEIVINYDYFCFVHDKKTSHAPDNYISEITFWRRNLWENSIGGEGYIYNIIDYFNMHDDVGLLVPPEPIGDVINHWYNNRWGVNYDNTVDLAKRLRLTNYSIDNDCPPITLGSVFWARTFALVKLFDYGWTYEDFLEEPMPVDGSVSHAIERIISYVAQDAGYKTGTIQSVTYAENMLSFLKDRISKTFSVLNDMGLAGSFGDIMNIYNNSHAQLPIGLEENIIDICNKYANIYIYGAGVWAKRLIKYMNCIKLKVTAIAVTSTADNPRYILDYPVYDVSCLAFSENDMVIIAIKDSVEVANISKMLPCKSIGIMELLDSK